MPIITLIIVPAQPAQIPRIKYMVPISLWILLDFIRTNASTVPVFDPLLRLISYSKVMMLEAIYKVVCVGLGAEGCRRR